MLKNINIVLCQKVCTAILCKGEKPLSKYSTNSYILGRTSKDIFFPPKQHFKILCNMFPLHLKRKCPCLLSIFKCEGGFGFLFFSFVLHLSVGTLIEAHFFSGFYMFYISVLAYMYVYGSVSTSVPTCTYMRKIQNWRILNKFSLSKMAYSWLGIVLFLLC